MRNYLSAFAIIVTLIIFALLGCGGPEYRCDECGQAFYTREELEEHKVIIHREEPGEETDDESGPVCDICGEKPASYEDFVTHMEEDHPREWRAIKDGSE